HQLITPALQSPDGMIATLGGKHKTMANQVISLLDEIHLIPSSTSGFGAIHPVVPTLSTRSLGRGPCFTNIRTRTNVAFGGRFMVLTMAAVRVKRKEKLLPKSIVAYIGAANEFMGRVFTFSRAMFPDHLAIQNQKSWLDFLQ
ncbi:hypothetical protein BDN72DRAFT_768348, partial [Pluteus cervinus]